MNIKLDLNKFIKYTRIYDKYPSLIICSMFTKNYNKIRVLKRSCEKHKISHILCEVPYIHDSKSAKCSKKYKFEFTQPNFIINIVNYIREHTNSSICLYLDADMYFRKPPKSDILNSTSDIIIYNWSGDPNYSMIYKPVINTHMWKCIAGVTTYNPKYLKCSSGVYGCNINSKYYGIILNTWHKYICYFSNNINTNTITAADDQILDLIWNNNLIPNKNLIKPLWLSKQYLRLPYWPWIKPIIKHPCKITSGINRPKPILTIKNNQILHSFPKYIKGLHKKKHILPKTINIKNMPFYETYHIEDSL